LAHKAFAPSGSSAKWPAVSKQIVGGGSNALEVGKVEFEQGDPAAVRERCLAACLFESALGLAQVPGPNWA
jgi:hypothetical protein